MQKSNGFAVAFFEVTGPLSQVQIVTFHQPTTVDKEPLLFGSGFGEMHPQGLSVWVGVSEKSSGVSKGYPFGTNLWKKGVYTRHERINE